MGVHELTPMQLNGSALCASAALCVSAIRSKQYSRHTAGVRRRRGPEPENAGHQVCGISHPGLL